MPANESSVEDAQDPQKPSRDECLEELAQLRVRCSVYKRLLERYAETIKQGEQRAVPELKALVNPEDPSVQAVKKLLLEDYAREASKGIEGAGPAFIYQYGRHFPALAQQTFDFVRSLRPVRSELSVPFWLSLRDIWELRAGDPFDKAVFLCSLFLALGSPNARVRVLELEGGLKHPVVLAEFQENVWLFDPSGASKRQEGLLESMLAAYRYEGKRSLHALYEFNNQEYRELAPHNGETSFAPPS